MLIDLINKRGILDLTEQSGNFITARKLNT